MASSTMKAVFLCVSVLVAAQLAMAATPTAATPTAAPAPSIDCLSVALTLSDCLGYVEGTDKAPPSACCKEAAPVINNNPQCLCILFNQTLVAQFGITINTTRALNLPKACKLTAPDPSLCTLLGYDVPGSPSASPSPTMAPSPTSGAPAPSSASSSASSPSGTSTSTSSAMTSSPSSSNDKSASSVLPLVSICSTALLSVAAAAASLVF